MKEQDKGFSLLCDINSSTPSSEYASMYCTEYKKLHILNALGQH